MKFKPLLEEFQDVIPKDIPPRLPPMCDIQYDTDFVPGSVISNKVAYRMSPEEHEELQRQVRELMDNGLVRESISLCAVTAFLVVKKDVSWRMCIDSRVKNKITIKYRFPIPRLDMLDQLHGARVFCEIDLDTSNSNVSSRRIEDRLQDKRRTS